MIQNLTSQCYFDIPPSPVLSHRYKNHVRADTKIMSVVLRTQQTLWYYAFGDFAKQRKWIVLFDPCKKTPKQELTLPSFTNEGKRLRVVRDKWLGCSSVLTARSNGAESGTQAPGLQGPHVNTRPSYHLEYTQQGVWPPFLTHRLWTP